jgi:O-antigen/teichoic acid export membrane protein
MRLGRNLAAGMASSAFTAVANLAVIPFYLSRLGVESYGLIGIFVTMQAIFQLFDLGLAQTVNREIARYSVEGKWKEAGNLLHTLASMYWGIAVFIGVAVYLMSGVVAEQWIQAEELSPESVAGIVQLIGVVIACRFPVGLYQGALNGLQLITTTSIASIAMTALASGGAVLWILFVSASIESFFVWQAFVGILYALTMRGLAWRAMPREDHGRFDAGELKRIWKFALGMIATALVSILVTQLDKVILSKMLTLEEFASYMLAVAMSAGLYLIVVPTYNALFPRFSGLVAANREAEILQLYRVGTRLFASVLFPAAFVVAAFSHEIVHVWTGDEALAQRVAPLLSVLSIGTGLHGLMYFPYALQLAYGLPRISLTIGLILLCVFAPLVVVLSSAYGAMGGALAWLFLHTAYVLLGAWLTHRRILKGLAVRWLVLDVFRPMLVAALVVATARHCLRQFDIPLGGMLVLASITGVIAVAAGMIVSPQACKVVIARIRAGFAPAREASWRGE